MFRLRRKRGTELAAADAEAGQLFWVDELGAVRYLGKLSAEDFKLVAATTEQAYSRLDPRRARLSRDTLRRVKTLTAELFERTK